MYCGKCGAQLDQHAEKCPACGNPVSSESDISRAGQSMPRARAIHYAGFWLRAVAFIIDFFLVLIVMAPPIFSLLVKNVGPQPTVEQVLAFSSGGTSQALAITLLIEMAYWLYYASLESSAWQATLGKRLLGLYVTNLAGQRISFARASGRYFGMVISRLTLLVGFLMAGFTAKKQALHDLLSGCLVLRKV